THTTVVTLPATDADARATPTFPPLSSTDHPDNASFTITGTTLKTNAVFDFETKSSYSIRVQADDGAGGTFAKQFTITVTNVNEQPTDVALTPSSVAENQPVNTVVGGFSTTDPDAGDTFTYTLVDTGTFPDNASFNVSGSNLRTSAAFDFETKSSYSIRVRTTDAGSLFFEKTLTITVTNVNEQPTDIDLSTPAVPDTHPANTAVDNLSTTDPD